MLWVNLIMDSFASLALATEPPTEILLQDKPYTRKDSILTKKMIKHILGQSIFQLVVILCFVFMGQNFIPEYKDEFDDRITTWVQDQLLKGIVVNPQVNQLDNPKYNVELYPDLFVRRYGILVNLSGRFRTVSGDIDYEDMYDEFRIPSRHYTVLFNLFVMLQVFNFLNSRKLKDELNIFENIGNKYEFL